MNPQTTQLILPTSELVSEMMTYHAYFGFYPGGVKAVVRDLFLGTEDSMKEWDRYDSASWANKDDVMIKAIDYLELEEFNLEKANVLSSGFLELQRIVVEAIEETRDKVNDIVLRLIGNRQAITFSRAMGNKWLGNDILVHATLR